MKHGRLMLGAALAVTSVWAIAQDAPESLLPPGFDKPAPPKANRAPAPAPSPAARPAAVPAAASAPAEGSSSGSAPVVQQVTGSASGSDSGSSSSSSASSAPVARIPTLEELEKLSPEELEQVLGIKPKFELGAAARRSMQRIGILSESEGGLVGSSLAEQNASLVRAALAGNKGMLVSRWGHIVLRRALASRLDAPSDMKPAEFAALRAALLVRMGEGEAARGVVQDVDPGNYTPELTQAALDAYLFTADITGICPVVTAQGDARKDDHWEALQAICAAFRGDGSAALSRLDRQAKSLTTLKSVDMLLAQKYAGATGKARRAVKIEWDGVTDMTPWRYALTIGVGLLPPEALMKNAGVRYDYMAATAPMLGLTKRAAAADNAASRGIVSSAAMVDTYSQIYADQDSAAPWAAQAELLHNAYVTGDAAGRLAAMRKLWDGAAGSQRYSRQVLTAYAAARLPAESGLASSAPDIVASMLAAGLDRNAMRWFTLADVGSMEWGMLSLADPSPSTAIELGDLKSFQGNDNSSEARKSAFLLAGLAGLERITPEVTSEFSERLGVDLGRQTRWTKLIQQSADVNNSALVALLAGLGMQGSGWDKMTPLHLYHIVATLRRVGFEAEARMIAAEAIARS